MADATLAVTEVREALVSRVADFGIMVRSVDVRYIILLGELKTILNQVIEAQKRGPRPTCLAESGDTPS